MIQPQQSFSDLFAELQQMDKDGNINAFIQKAATHLQSLRLIRAELSNTIQSYLSKYPEYISPDSFNMISNTPGLIAGCKLSKLPPAPESNIPGRIYTAVVTTYGHAREIRIENVNHSTLSPYRLSQLDRVGSTVFSSLETLLGRFLFFNPMDYFFLILDTYGIEDELVEGRSSDLALGLCLVSWIAQINISAKLSAAGELKRDGSIKPVQAIAEKLTALKRERYFIEEALVSADQNVGEDLSGIKPIRVKNIHEAINYCFPHMKDLQQLSTGFDVKKEISHINEQYQLYLIDSCIKNADQLILYLESTSCKLPKDEILPYLFTCYWKKGSCYCHKGDVEKAEIALNTAIQLYENQEEFAEKRVIPAEQFFGSKINYAILLKDIFRYRDAENLHSQIKEELERSNSVDHLKGKNASSLSQLYLAQQRYKEALLWQNRALKQIKSSDLHRNYCYRAQIYMRAGDFGEAEKDLNQAKALLDRTEPKIQRKNLPFYHWFRAEYVYRKTLKTLKKSQKLIEIVSILDESYTNIDYYVPALIQKYIGLTNLLWGYENEGLERLSRVASYFDAQIVPVYKVIGATVHAERALYHLKNNIDGKVKRDLEIIVKNLNMLRDFRAYFLDEITAMSKFLNQGHHEAPIIDVLKSTIQKIPY